MEREQAVRLIRAYIDCVDGMQALPYSIPSILVSISEQGDDKLRPIALQTICEMGNS
jgi:rapamycin-insensitive companion of mTOR